MSDSKSETVKAIKDVRVAAVIDFIKGSLGSTDVGELAVMLGLGYMSYDSPIRVGLGDLGGFLYGPLAFKLATSPSWGGASAGIKILGTGFDIPINSQILGMVMLGSIGVVKLPWQELRKFLTGSEELIKPVADAITLANAFIASPDSFYLTIPENLEFRRLLFKAEAQLKLGILGVESSLWSEGLENFGAYVQGLWDVCKQRNPNRPGESSPGSAR